MHESLQDLVVEFSCPLGVMYRYYNTERVMLLLWLRSSFSSFFSFVLQHSGGILFPLRQLRGNRLGDLFASAGLFPENVFWFCCPGNPHWTHLSSCIQTHCVWEKIKLLYICLCVCHPI